MRRGYRAIYLGVVVLGAVAGVAIAGRPESVSHLIVTAPSTTTTAAGAQSTAVAATTTAVPTTATTVPVATSTSG